MIEINAKLLAFVFCLMGYGCEHRGDRNSRKLGLEGQHPISAESYRSTAKAARIVEGEGDGRTSGPAMGESMEPLFGSNVYLVIEPIAYEDLRPGMIVAYTGLSGERVVHQLVEKENGYWTVIGINNTYEDNDYVTPMNLIGVVYGAFHAAE